MSFSRQDQLIHTLFQQGLVGSLIDIWGSQLKDETLNDKWKELQKTASATISRILENSDTIKYQEVKGLQPHIMDELVSLYSAEEKNIDYSFFLGIGVDNILDCTIAINAIIRFG